MDKNKKIIILAVVFLVFFIFGTASLIYYLDNHNNTSPKSTLIGFQSLKKEVASLQKNNPDLQKSRNFNIMIEQLASLESTGITKEQQFNSLNTAFGYVQITYSDTSNHSLYVFSGVLNKFIRENFPEKNFTSDKIICLDPECSQNPTPPEIQAVIEEIKKSSLSSEMKADYVQLLTATGYIDNDENLSSKVFSYLSIASSIEQTIEFEKDGLNVKLPDEIINYVKNAFPEEYEKNKLIE